MLSFLLGFMMYFQIRASGLPKRLDVVCEKIDKYSSKVFVKIKLVWGRLYFQQGQVIRSRELSFQFWPLLR